MMATIWLMMLIVLGAAVQAQLPTFRWWGGAHIELLPALVAYAALTCRRASLALGLAVLAGGMQDSLSAAPFGLSAMSYATAAWLLLSLGRFLDRDLPWIQIFAGATTALAANLVAWAATGFPAAGLLKIAWLVVSAGVLAPFVFFGLDQGKRALTA